MVITTILAYFVARRSWGWGRVKALSVVSIFLFIDTAFFFANLVKIPDGGWFPLVVGGIMYFLMATWQRGRAIDHPRTCDRRRNRRQGARNLCRFS